MHTVGTRRRSPFHVPPLPRSFPLFLRSPRHPSSFVLCSPDAGPSYRSHRLFFSTLCASSPSIQTPGPGTVEIIKRRPAFGATSGIRVGALYSRHYPPRKLGRDETAFLSPSSSHRLRLCTVLLSPCLSAFSRSSCHEGRKFSHPVFLPLSARFLPSLSLVAFDLLFLIPELLTCPTRVNNEFLAEF